MLGCREEDTFQGSGLERFQTVEILPAFLRERAQDVNHKLRDGQIGLRTFLNVEHANLNAATTEPGDGPTRV